MRKSFIKEMKLKSWYSFATRFLARDGCAEKLHEDPAVWTHSMV